MKLTRQNFVNRVKRFFNKPKNVEAEKTTREVKRYVNRAQAKNIGHKSNRKNYGQGGCMGANGQAEFHPPSRGKIKGYMKTSNAA